MNNFTLYFIEKFGRTIHLSKERWNHIVIQHPEVVSSFFFIEQTLQNPTAIRESTYDPNVRWYYSYDKKRKGAAKFFLVSVKYLNGHGYIITVFYTTKIK